MSPVTWELRHYILQGRHAPVTCIAIPISKHCFRVSIAPDQRAKAFAIVSQ